MITTTNPRTGQSSETELRTTSAAGVAEVVTRSVAAAAAFSDLGREGRAVALDAVADQVESRRAELVAVADDETALGHARLEGEVARTAFQFRLFATAVREGSYLEATIDSAAETPLGPAPEIRRMLVPIGPVAVFGSSNFPFAFSVLGGDTASALAAGCPVVAKAHDSHPLTAQLSSELLVGALSSAGAPPGTVGIVFGKEAGRELVLEPAITAVGFTGSLTTGRLLLDLIATRAAPIPFYGELSSLNPLIITPGAAGARADEIAAGLVASVTGSGGQLCTKPGVAFLPAGVHGDRLANALRDAIVDAPWPVLLNERIMSAYDEIRSRLSDNGAQRLAESGRPSAQGFAVAPTLLETTAARFTRELAEECFGPLVVLVRYDGLDDLRSALASIPGSLAASIHVEPDEASIARELATELATLAGRIVFNGYPTGVRVSWGQHHGGPWPSTNSLHTSVGVSAIRRFLRPLAWQDAPASILPAELRDGPASIPRRIDGRLVLPG
jgi:NADP-dependent aldehyde dehydrogenase